MQIIFFTKGDTSIGSSRQRVWRLAERLKNAYGYDYDAIHNINHSVWIPSFKRFRNLKKIYYALYAKRYTLIYVHKSLFPWDVILLIFFAKRWRRKKLIFDLDDAEWIHSPRKSKFLARYADYVICGSHAILQWAQQYCHHCILIPTAVDHELYHAYRVHHIQRDMLTIGWVGAGKAHYRQGNFALIKPTLEQLAQKKISFRFVLIGSQYCEPLKQFFRGSSFEIIFVDELNWRDPASVARAIHEYQFDIGLMPLVDTPFNRAKCAFKAIEYMACGVPVVASNVGENTVVVQHGKTGFIAETQDEWIRFIETLARDALLRSHVGAAGMKIVSDHYSYAAVLPMYQNIIQTLITP